MTIAKLEDYLSKLTSHVIFNYDGISCGIDPLSRNRFDMWYGNKCITLQTVADVLYTKFFDGKSLKDIWDDITELDY